MYDVDKDLDKRKKCCLSDCLNLEDGKCSLTPPVFKPKHNDKHCKYYDNDFKKTYEEFKRAGGVLGEYMRKHGKLSEDDAKEIKSEKRKAKKRSKENNK